MWSTPLSILGRASGLQWLGPSSDLEDDPVVSGHNIIVWELSYGSCSSFQVIVWLRLLLTCTAELVEATPGR